MPKKILIVDDEADTLKSIKTVLEKEGFNVDCANNGEECIEKTKEDKYSLILIDIYMPGMSGEEMFKALRKTINHLTPLAYVTIKPKSSVDVTDIDGFIQKPFKNKELIGEVKRILEDFKPPKK